MSDLETRGAVVARPDGTVTLISGVPEVTEALANALVPHGCLLVASGTATIDPDSVEVDGREARLLVVPLVDPDAAHSGVRRLTGGEAAYIVGSQAGATALGAVRGGPLPALARLARRVAAYEVRYADPAVGAREVARLWSTH